MTAIADLAALLLSTGIPPEKIAAAIDIAERHANERVEFHRNSTGIPPETAHEKRKRWDRERKRAKSGIPPESGLSAISSSSLPLSQDPPKEESKKEGARGKKLPDDWKPTETHYAEGRRLGMSVAMVDEAATDLRIWAEANSNRAVARKSNWDLTFLGWLRRNRSPPRMNGQSVPRHGSREDTRERTVRALDKLTDYLEFEANDKGRGGEARQAPLGILPFAKPA